MSIHSVNLCAQHQIQAHSLSVNMYEVFDLCAPVTTLSTCMPLIGSKCKNIVFLAMKRSVIDRNSYFAGTDRRIDVVRKGLWVYMSDMCSRLLRFENLSKSATIHFPSSSLIYRNSAPAASGTTVAGVYVPFFFFFFSPQSAFGFLYPVVWQ